MLNKNESHAKKEMQMDNDFVESIVLKEGYSSLNRNCCIGKIYDLELLENKFSHHYNLEKFNDVKKEKQHIITGFGPTNAPTGGTLSMILRAIFFDKEANIDSTIIISDLGAYNSRNIELSKAKYFTKRFLKFIRLLGYRGEIRTHSNYNLLVTSSITSKFLNIKDFIENEEVIKDLYDQLGIQGRDFSTFVDENFTVADILLPCIVENKERVLVFVGMEEYYFPKLSNLVISRMKKSGLERFISADSLVCAVFGRLIGGLNGFPKMSKSIPESSINLDNSEEEITGKILRCDSNDEKIIFQMINIVSDWKLEKLKQANEAFYKSEKDWMQVKIDYLKYFLDLKRKWESTDDKEYDFDLNSLFK